MTVYLKGLNGMPRQIEKNVQTVSVDDKLIRIRYKQNKNSLSIVTGVTYRKADAEIERIEE